MNPMIVTQANKLAATLGMTEDDSQHGRELIETLKATAFKGQVTDAQMTALLIVANQYGLSPWTKEIYAFPDKQNGIVPVIGVDGWARIINDHPQFDGMDFEQDEESCTCTIYRKDRTRPIRVTEYLSECRRNTGPWNSHPKRMLRHKAMIQCARLAFGFTGIYDEDEAERIKDITPMGETQTAKPAGPQRASKKTARPAAAQTNAYTKEELDQAEDATVVSESSTDQAPVNEAPVLANEAWIQTLRARMKANNKTEEETLAHFNLQQLEGITQDQAIEIAGWITGQ